MRSNLLAVAVSALALSGTAQAQTTTFTALLSGFFELQEGDLDASGDATITIHRGQRE